MYTCWNTTVKTASPKVFPRKAMVPWGEHKGSVRNAYQRSFIEVNHSNKLKTYRKRFKEV